jgi:hypothetical protein
MGLIFYSHRFLFECVKMFTGLRRVNFWFAAPGEDRESLIRGLGEGKLRFINR